MQHLGFTYDAMEQMRTVIEEMAQRIEQIASSKDKIVVKYDSDGDGLSGALILYRMFVKLKKDADATFVQSPSPVYRVEDAMRDVEIFPNAHFIFIDGENNDDSEDGLAILRKSAKTISIIDHHLSTRKKAPGEIVVTPIWHGLGYEYTSGFLCYEIARRVCDADYEMLWKASLYCDKSTLEYEITEEIEEVGLVLDYISTVMNHEKHSIEFIDKLISSREMRRVEYLSAKDSIDMATRLALSIARWSTLANGTVVVLVEVGRIVESGEFPPRGKVTGRVHDAFIEKDECKGKAVVTIGYTSDSLMVRANKKALEAGFNGNSIIEELKKEMGNIIISGGGHAGASAMKFVRGFDKVVIDAFVRKIAAVG
ncbi:MAG: hypothetical protein N3G76_01480 [Candidatus Micrarchaeota archaeon]|nr:hypothetical protein [Candidatus Micrarchaeota archaeon]